MGERAPPAQNRASQGVCQGWLREGPWRPLTRSEDAEAGGRSLPREVLAHVLILHLPLLRSAKISRAAQLDNSKPTTLVGRGGTGGRMDVKEPCRRRGWSARLANQAALLCSLSRTRAAGLPTPNIKPADQSLIAGQSRPGHLYGQVNPELVPIKYSRGLSLQKCTTASSNSVHAARVNVKT